MPSAAKPTPATTPMASVTSDARRRPPAMCAPKTSPSARKYATWPSATIAAPARAGRGRSPRAGSARRRGGRRTRPRSPARRRCPARRRRAAATASAPPRAGSRGSRGRGGSPGRPVVRCRPPTLTARNSDGKITSGARNCGRRSELRSGAARERELTADQPLSAHAGAAAAPSAPSRCWPVLAMKTSSSVGSHELERRRPGSPPRPARGRRRRCRRRRRRAATDRWQPSRRGRPRSPNCASSARARGRGRRASSASAMSRCGPADLGLQRGGRALGDDPAAADDPHAVGELVGLLEVLRRQEDRRALVLEPPDLVPQRHARDRVQARSSARRGTAPRARGSAPSPGPAGGACRPE